MWDFGILPMLQIFTLAYSPSLPNFNERDPYVLFFLLLSTKAFNDRLSKFCKVSRFQNVFFGDCITYLRHLWNDALTCYYPSFSVNPCPSLISNLPHFLLLYILEWVNMMDSLSKLMNLKIELIR